MLTYSNFSDLFQGIQLDTPLSYKLQHNSGVAWYIIDTCLMKMKRGECAEFRINYLDQLIVVKLQLEDFTLAPDTWEMSVEQKHSLAAEMKLLGTNLLKGKEYLLAAEKYGLALKLLISDGCRGQSQDSHEEKISLIRMNMSLCFMKLNAYEGVIYHSKFVLEYLENPDIAVKIPKCQDHMIKTLYRRAWAYCQINEFEKCKSDISRVLELDPDNGETIKLLTVVESRVKQNDRKMSNNLRSMFR